MDYETFHKLPTTKVAQHVRAASSKVCVFPINGTRRWFLLEYPEALTQDLAVNYLDVAGKRYVELFQLFFDHGVDTLLIPIFGPDLLTRSEMYVRAVAEGMAHLTNHPRFLTFYDEYDVRVRFYGDHRKFLGSTSATHLSELFDAITQKTVNHQQFRIFFGVFAHDATETIAELSVQYYTKYGKVPDKQTLVELYYGEYVSPVDFFIGFDKLAAFDMPLIATGSEDLYFTVAPSLYLGQEQLREILYDHLYTRPEEETDYEDLTSEDWASMRDFYHANLTKTLGVGARQKRGSFWYPAPQVHLPENFKK